MAWQQLFDTCPECGANLHADTSTGDVVCLECDYESGYSLPDAVIGPED